MAEDLGGYADDLMSRESLREGVEDLVIERVVRVRHDHAAVGFRLVNSREHVVDGLRRDKWPHQDAGLQGIADRLAAIGGELEVASTPGRGTTITGQVPVGGGAR